MADARTLFEKVWDAHKVVEDEDGWTLLYVDRLYIADDILPDVFSSLSDRGLRMRRPERAFGMPDHYVPTTRRHMEESDDLERRVMVETLTRASIDHRFRMFALDDPRQGIVHVTGPEQGLSLPGSVIVCADSHTSTHGALGALAFGIGYSEFAHVAATQSLWQTKPKTMRITIDGALGKGVFAKDVILAIIAEIGVAGGRRHVIEYAGETIRNMSIEGRMTICNMSIEAGARGGMIAPDKSTFAYLKGRPFAPQKSLWDEAVAGWRGLSSDPGTRFDRELAIDAGALRPMITWGTTPEDAIAITQPVPKTQNIEDAGRRAHAEKALEYMGLTSGAPLEGLPIDCVFIGSCTNGRIEDLREAASIIGGRRVRIPTFVVPGSTQVKQQAEKEGLAKVFEEAGVDWRHAGCSMCIAINGDAVPAGQRCASTTNRNFINRQGPRARTHLMSPAMAAAAAVTGRLVDVRGL